MMLSMPYSSRLNPSVAFNTEAATSDFTRPSTATVDNNSMSFFLSIMVFGLNIKFVMCVLYLSSAKIGL